MLHNFRVAAGLPSTAKPLGGWEDPRGELRGHTVGHYLAACALMYASTGDLKVKAKADYIVAELAKCQAAMPKPSGPRWKPREDQAHGSEVSTHSLGSTAVRCMGFHD